jgi:hypothetical protein
LAAVEEVLEDPPQAARPRLASSRNSAALIAMAVPAGLRLLLSM